MQKLVRGGGAEFFGNFSEGITSANIRYLGEIFVLAHAKKCRAKFRVFAMQKSDPQGKKEISLLNFNYKREF